MDDELIVLCDKDGNPTGSAPKLASHHENTPLHRAFSVYLFRSDGKFLVTQRALSKKVWPGVWTNSCCGHPSPGESDEEAIRRRVDYELGGVVADIAVLAPNYSYKTPPFHGIIEHEFCPVYIGTTDESIAPNPDEVAAYQWMDWNEYVEKLTNDTGDVYSWWAKDQLSYIKDNQLLARYSKSN